METASKRIPLTTVSLEILDSSADNSAVLTDSSRDLSKTGKVSVAAIISKKHKTKNLIVFEDFKSTISKTKKMFEILNQNNAKNAILILDKTSKENIYKSAKNIPNIKITDVNHFSSFDLLKYNKIIFTETSIKELEKKYD